MRKIESAHEKQETLLKELASAINKTKKELVERTEMFASTSNKALVAEAELLVTRFAQQRTEEIADVGGPVALEMREHASALMKMIVEALRERASLTEQIETQEHSWQETCDKILRENDSIKRESIRQAI